MCVLEVGKQQSTTKAVVGAVMFYTPEGFQDAQLEALNAVLCIWPPNASSLHPDAHPLQKCGMKRDYCYIRGTDHMKHAKNTQDPQKTYINTSLPLTWTLGKMFWKGAACNKSHTSSWDCMKGELISEITELNSNKQSETSVHCYFDTHMHNHRVLVH